MIVKTQGPARSTVPASVRRLLERPPAAGHGIHRWLYRAACGMKNCCGSEEAFRMLKAATERCGRVVPDREIADAVRNSQPWNGRGTPPGLRKMLNNGRSGVNTPTSGGWPPPDWPHISAVASTGMGIEDLRRVSPVPISDRHTADFFLEVLFPGQPLLCLARENPWDARTAPWETWRNPRRFGLIVPSPMRAKEGKRKDGKPSARCLDNTGPRRYLVVEFDFATRGGEEDSSPENLILARLAAEVPCRTAPDLCAALLLHLIRMGAPMVLAVHSGGKSVHGWFPALGQPEENLRRFFSCACRLGADPATWTPCQLVRLPGGTRANGTPQKVLYFNPSLLPAA
jgi:hypothetical protein